MAIMALWTTALKKVGASPLFPVFSSDTARDGNNTTHDGKTMAKRSHMSVQHVSPGLLCHGKIKFITVEEFVQNISKDKR